MNSCRNIVKVGQNVIQYDVIVTDSDVQIKASLMCILWFLHRDFFPPGVDLVFDLSLWCYSALCSSLQRINYKL